MRYLGIIRSHISNPYASKMLFIEMAARTAKNILRQRLRDTFRQQQRSKTHDRHNNNKYQDRTMLVADFVNTLIGNGNNSKLFWRGELMPKLRHSYPAKRPKDLTLLLPKSILQAEAEADKKEIEAEENVEAVLGLHDVIPFLTRFCRLSEVSISDVVLKEIKKIAKREMKRQLSTVTRHSESPKEEEETKEEGMKEIGGDKGELSEEQIMRADTLLNSIITDMIGQHGKAATYEALKKMLQHHDEGEKTRELKKSNQEEALRPEQRQILRISDTRDSPDSHNKKSVDKHERHRRFAELNIPFMTCNFAILTSRDITKIGSRVRHIPIVDELVGKSAFLNAKALQAETASLSTLSDEEPPFDASIKLRFQQAIESYSKAIARLGHSRAMIGLAGVYLEYALYEHKLT
jgi:hypothetical protein